MIGKRDGARILVLAIAAFGLLGARAAAPVTRAQTVPAPRPLDIVGHLGGAPGDVAVRGTLAYVAGGYALEVWDLSDPFRPVRIGALPRPGVTPGNGSQQLQRLHVEGSTALLVDRNAVRIIDIADPAAPRELGAFRLPGTGILDAVRLGATMYVAASDSGWGITVVDISSPAAPRVIGYTRDGDYTRLAVAGGCLYAIAARSTEPPSERGLRVFDLVQPASPVALSFSEGVTATYDLVITGSRLYAAGHSGVHVYSIGDPTAVQSVGVIHAAEGVDAVAVRDTRAYLLHGGVLEEVDVADPGAPMPNGRLQLSTARSGRTAGYDAIAAGEGVVVATVFDAGTFVVASPATAPMRRGSEILTELPGRVHDVAVAGGSAWVLTARGLVEVDVSNVRTPSVRAAIEPDEGSYRDIAVHDTTLCVLAETDDHRIELHVLDVRDPGVPRQRAVLHLGQGNPSALAVRGRFAFAAATHFQDGIPGTYDRRVHVIDVGDPASPRLAGELEVAENWSVADGRPNLALANTRMLVGTYAGMMVADISDAMWPTTIGSLPRTGPSMTVWSLTGTETRAYLAFRSSVAGDEDNLAVIDLGDPAHPAIVSRLSGRYAPTSLALSRNHLFTGGFEGVQMFATDGPGFLSPAARQSLPAWVRGIALHEGYAYVADDDAGLFILYTGDPDLPVIVPPTVPPATATPSPTPTPAVDCICRVILGKVPPAVIADAAANPDRVEGWGLPLNPNKPIGPDNPPRTCLSLARVSVPYHPIWNTVEWKAGCP